MAVDEGTLAQHKISSTFYKYCLTGFSQYVEFQYAGIYNKTNKLQEMECLNYNPASLKMTL